MSMDRTTTGNKEVIEALPFPTINPPEISIIVPCFNEEEAIQTCIDQIKKVIRQYNLNTEVIFVDNASTDNSPKILKQNLANLKELIVYYEPRKGYGSAYLCGLKHARGQYIFMADCDNTYDFNEIPHFVNKLRDTDAQKGADLVVGNRFAEKMKKGVMPWHHKYVGNPFLSFLVKFFFKVKINDIHCGARAIKKSAFEQIVLSTHGMEFASEMIIKCAKQGMKIIEVPITYRARIGTSKLNSFSDGWRHLRFILLYSPPVMFLLPGAFLFLIGAISIFILYFTTSHIFDLQHYVYLMFLSSILMIVGYELILFAGFTRAYAIAHLGNTDSFLDPLYQKINIEKAGLTGILLSLLGITIYLFIFVKWIHSGFDSFDEVRNGVVTLTLLTLGVQTLLSAFMFGILGIKEK